ncbi:Adenosylcobalamin-dependent ribonucleoside-triphosphate reductase [compost metagenome]
MSVYTPFKFTEEQLAPYKGKDPQWGAVGVITYKRTYSRKEQNRREEWLETLARVIEGNINLGRAVGDPTATDEWALEALEYFYYMGVMPPGRGYWMMGTEYAEKRGGDALNNCWYVAVKPQSYENMEMFKGTWGGFSSPEGPMPSYPFVFMFDRAMLGGGVGFGVNEKNLSQYKPVRNNVVLKIVLDESHPDWDRIKSSEEYSRFNLHRHLQTDLDEKDYLAVYYLIDDSREGWDVAVREVIDSHWYNWSDSSTTTLVIDLSKIRGYGEDIKGFGGTASGPLPLIAAMVTINNILNSRVGENLRGVDGLDIMNILGRCVVAGNVRRTALISLGDHTDKDYVEAKNYTLVSPIIDTSYGNYGWYTNEWGRMTQKLKDKEVCIKEAVERIRSSYTSDTILHPYELADIYAQAEEEVERMFDMFWKQDNHRWASNNSVYTYETFKDHHFIAAGIIANGEPGVGNEWLMKNFGRIVDGFQEAIDADAEGLNPCAEITLANGEPCNLVEFVPYRAKKFGFDFKRCLTIAAQYTYRITFAHYMWPSTQRIIAKNRRIGVSLTGMQDYFLEHHGRYAVVGFEVTEDRKRKDITRPIFYQPIVDELDQWYNWVKDANHEHAKLMGSTPSIKLTTVKPSGTVAKLPGVSSGIHWHYAPYMLQRIRFHETDPNLKVIKMCGFPIEKAAKEPNTVVVEFPVKNPNADSPYFRSAGKIPLEEQFANQYLFARYWADNAVSATLTFKQEETDKIESLLAAYNNRIKSTSLLPYSGHGYVQAPWEPISKEEYDKRLSKISITPDQVYQLMIETGVDILGDDSLIDPDCEGGACPTR